jgi:RNA polymerase sigma-70 factor (ECF subfamily)
MVASKAQRLEELFQCHFDGVYRYVAYRVAPDLETARDITQEVFVAAFEQLDGYRGDASSLTWLRSIARHKVADHFRAGAGNARQHHEDLEALRTASTPAAAAGEAQAVLVSLAMRQLPEHYVEALEEKYIEALSVTEMASKRQMSDKAVESMLSRAREAFRIAFEKLRAREEGKT